MLLRHSVCAQILVGNKCDIDESKRAVPYSKGQALANEFGIKFFETSAKSNINVEEVSGRSATGSQINALEAYGIYAEDHPHVCARHGAVVKQLVS